MPTDRHPKLVRIERDATAPIDTAVDLAHLLARSAAGDETAFAELYDATSSRVFGLILRVIRSHALAEETSQEVYLQVWRTASRYDPDKGSALAWLMTIAHRRAVDRIRATESSTRRDNEYHQGDNRIEHDVTADAVEASLESARVRAALAHLTPRQRQVLELAYFGGHTHVEIAEIVGIPVGTAKTRIRDGIVRLRSLMSEAC